MALLTRFQFASTPFTITLNDVPAVCGEVEPLLPDGVPGAALSPGNNNCSFTNVLALTVMLELVLAVFVPSELSVAVTVRAPAAFIVTGNVCVPFTSAAAAGRVAFVSLELMLTVSLTPVIKFQFVSTALTVTVKLAAALWPVGAPVLPVAVPGAADSPGARTCNFANGPGFTVRLELCTPLRPVAVAVIAVVSALGKVVVSVVVDWPEPKFTAVT